MSCLEVVSWQVRADVTTTDETLGVASKGIWSPGTSARRCTGLQIRAIRR